MTLGASLSLIGLFAVIPVYINFALYSRFFCRRKYTSYFIFLSLLILCLATFGYYFFAWVFNVQYHYAQWIGNAIFVVILGTAIKVFKDGIRERIQVHEIKAQQLESELALLKSQINPHFFFNTLNSLYALSLMKSELVPGVILKLSELMRFVLSSSKQNYVALASEIEFLQNYLSLEKFRFERDRKIDFVVQGDCTDKTIAPLLLVPFVENSFKHGVRADAGRFYVRIYAIVSDSTLMFVVENSRAIESQQHQSDSQRLGLLNVQRRLELLYPNRHRLTISHSSDHYSVTLKLQL